MHKRILYLASKNQHKLAELRSLLGTESWDVRPATDLDPNISWIESGATFVDNARIKARKLREYTKAAVLADDSGLSVFALGGAPGVYSSRYAGEDGNDAANNRKLLCEMRDVPMSARRAEFICTLLMIDEAGHEAIFEGRCFGRILPAPSGKNGFGYDPLFFVDAAQTSMAELDAARKNQLSHRGQALRAFLRHRS